MWEIDVFLAAYLTVIALFYGAMVHFAQPDPATESGERSCSPEPRHQTV